MLNTVTSVSSSEFSIEVGNTHVRETIIHKKISEAIKRAPLPWKQNSITLMFNRVESESKRKRQFPKNQPMNTFILQKCRDTICYGSLVRKNGTHWESQLARPLASLKFWIRESRLNPLGPSSALLGSEPATFINHSSCRTVLLLRRPIWQRRSTVGTNTKASDLVFRFEGEEIVDRTGQLTLRLGNCFRFLLNRSRISFG